MDFFQWDDSFLTGLPGVDKEHCHLVNLINEFGEHLSRNDLIYADIEALIKELVRYSSYHFEKEERLMVKKSIDIRHVKKHKEIHQSFLQEIIGLSKIITKEDLGSAKYLMNFLTSWLACHILGIDQNMARQATLIESGATSKEAFEIEEKSIGDATKLLLKSVDALINQVSARNKELLQLNQSLERKVKQRTQELEDANRLLTEVSLTDVLTQLPNRRFAMKKLELLWNESIEKKLPLTCIMIDADYFKEVNDTYGHDAGDLVLKKLGIGLLNAFRTDDIVCRLGGDEFLVICPNTDIIGGMKIANITCSKISKFRVPTGGKPWHGSVSIGVASSTPEVKNFVDLMKIADQGLYLAKERGKGRVETVIEY